jgi:hypothetical protein
MATTPKKTAKKSKDMGSARVSTKDVKKVPRTYKTSQDRPAPKVNQDKPRTKGVSVTDDRYDFDDTFGPKAIVPSNAKAGRIQAAKAMEKVSPKRPATYGTNAKDKVGYKGGR